MILSRSRLEVYFLLASCFFNFQGYHYYGCHAQVDDRCDDAIPITIGGDAISASTVGQGLGSSLYFNRCGDGQVFDVTTSGVWFRVTGTKARLRATTCFNDTDDFDHRISIFSGNPGCEDRVCVVSGTEPSSDCPLGHSSFVEWDTIPRAEFFIFIHDRLTGESGNFTVAIEDVTEAPDNDTCENATVLIEDDSTLGTTVGATLSTGLQCDRCIEGAPKYPGVWYSIPAESYDSKITVITCSVYLRLDVAVFGGGGSTCGDFECQSTEAVYNETCSVLGFRSEFEWEVEAGQEFFLYVHAYDDESNDLKIGSFQILYSRQESVEPSLDDSSSISTRLGLWSRFVLVGYYLFLTLY